MRIFMVIVKAVCGECYTYFFNNKDDANKFAFEKWIGLCEEERLDTYIGVYWIDLTSAFDSLTKPDGQISDQLDWGSDDSCFSSKKLIANAQNLYHEYPSAYFGALDELVKSIGGDTGQNLKQEGTEVFHNLNKVYLKALEAAGIPLGLLDKY